MHTFLNWFIPIAAFLLFEIPSWWIDKRLKQKIPSKALRFLVVRSVTVVVLTILISAGLKLFVHATSINIGGIFVLLCVLYLILWIIVGLNGLF